MRNKIDLTITKINTSSFNGEVFASELGINLPEGDDTLNFVGSYIVHWDDVIPQVEIESITIFFRKLDLEIPLNRVDVESIAEWIEQQGPQMDWLADRQAALTDYYYDMYRDGLFD